MSATSGTPKLLPRNAPAARRFGHVTGNPVTTRLEDAVGNCFPGLEFDLRNLERRFFPGLAIDLAVNAMVVAEVDEGATKARGLSAPQRRTLAKIASDLETGAATWRVVEMTGVFGFAKDEPRRTLDVPRLLAYGIGQLPDAWTAIRLMPQDSEVKLVLQRTARGAKRADPKRETLTAKRARYTDPNGALAAAFHPGELTQSLCSPWTHDFRDCACFYWASNHPDIVQPARPDGATDPRWSMPAQWERADRSAAPDAKPPVPANAEGAPDTGKGRILDHLEINARWRELDFILEGREIRAPYVAGGLKAEPLDVDALEAQLRYAAGIELAVIQMYLSAAFSLNLKAGAPGSALHNDVKSAQAELMRVTFAEMHHLRVVNDVLRAWLTSRDERYTPALRVTHDLPRGPLGTRLPFEFRSLTRAVRAEFIDIERPSVSVDGLYARVFVTLEKESKPALAGSVQSIMSDGADHYQTFLFIDEWLTRHRDEKKYLHALREPTPRDADHVSLNKSYAQLLRTLSDAYTAGLPGGKDDLAHARHMMLNLDVKSGLLGACNALVKKGIRVKFDDLKGEFAPIDPPKGD